MKLGIAGCLSAAVVLSGVTLAQQSPSMAQLDVVPVPVTSTLATTMTNATSPPTPPLPSPASAPTAKHKLGPFEISVNWRTRAEGWNWFQGGTGNSDYGLWNSLLRVGIGQTRENFDWFIEGEQPSILGLPNDAVVPVPRGQLGLGGTYYAANNNHTNEANGFVKQAFVNFKRLGPAALKLGRFEYFDGAEVKPKDALLATVIQTRITHRLISNFGFSAVQRAFDGVQCSLNSGQNNFTFFGARPTAGVFQVKGMDELDVDIYAGTYSWSISSRQNAGELRIFAMGYVDHRTLVLKTDNRPQTVRAADHGKIEIATYGLDYAHVYNAQHAGKFDFILWGAVQNGSWGMATAGACAEAVDQCGLFLRQWRQRPERRAPRHFLSASAHAPPICALSLLQHDE